MLIKRLLEHYDCYTKLPIGINDVKDQLIALGVQDEIRFHFVDIDVSVVRGVLYRYVRHGTVYGDPVRCAEICIANNMSDEWKRLVAVKELLHITDCERITAQSRGAVENLFANLSLPPEVRGQHGTDSSFNDKTRVISALAILVPLQCRAILRDKYRQGRITLSEVALTARIPERYVQTIMDIRFENVLDSLLQWETNKNGLR